MPKQSPELRWALSVYLRGGGGLELGAAGAGAGCLKPPVKHDSHGQKAVGLEHGLRSGRACLPSLTAVLFVVRRQLAKTQTT